MSSINPLIQFLIREAEPLLPNPIEYGGEEIIIPVSLSKEDWQKYHLSNPDREMQVPFFNVLFRKYYVGGEVTGWKFIEAD